MYLNNRKAVDHVIVFVYSAASAAYLFGTNQTYGKQQLKNVLSLVPPSILIG